MGAIVSAAALLSFGQFSSGLSSSGLSSSGFSSSGLSSPSLSAALSPQLATAAASGKGAKAATEFEAQLIGSLLESLEKTFSALPGPDSTPGADDYNYLGTHALAEGIAAHGGFGIAAMIAHYLQAHADPAQSGSSQAGSAQASSAQAGSPQTGSAQASSTLAGATP